MELFKIQNLTYKYPSGKVNVLNNISLTIEKGSFNVICGPTGSGKTTLLRMLKNELRPLGNFSGNIFFKNKDLTSLSERESASLIGFVLQSPEEQIVTDKVWHELAFGLENLGVENEVIRRRVAETTSYFGIEDLFEKNVNILSGGEKQLLNLAAVMTLNPEVLILDEPTSQLDPLAAASFISTINKLNKDLGITIIMTEHRLEEIISCADNLIIMEEGSITAFGPTREVIATIIDNEKLIVGMPSAIRIACKLKHESEIPINVREGRQFIENYYCKELLNNTPSSPNRDESKKKAVVEVNNLSFRYDRTSEDILKNLSFSVYEGESFCILGGNGAGKTTTLHQIAGLLRPYEGYIRIHGKKIKDYKGQELYKGVIGFLPQEVKSLFIEYTVREELKEVNCDIDNLPYDISSLLDIHPYDLSGGEQQLVGLAKVLASTPRIILMDEPTKGLDAYNKKIIINIIEALKNEGKTIICVTHDIEFAAECADRCAMLFKGEMTSIDTTTKFFSGMNYYTTAVHKMTKEFSKEIVTVEQLLDVLK